MTPERISRGINIFKCGISNESIIVTYFDYKDDIVDLTESPNVLNVTVDSYWKDFGKDKRCNWWSH